MPSIWDIVNEIELNCRINPGACRLVISQASSISDIRKYLDAILTRLQNGDNSAIQETWTVAVPLAYRLAVDDTSSNYRIASQLKEAAMRLMYPQLMQACQSEIDFLCNCAYGIKYSDFPTVQNDVLEKLILFSDSLKGKWIVYSRLKSISSILVKLNNIYRGRKIPKNRDKEFLTGIAKLLLVFENNVSERMCGREIIVNSYDSSVVKWLIPDLLACTLQFSEDNDSVKNMGAAKAIYRGVHKKLLLLPIKIFYGPSYSHAWHMNRMVCYIDYEINSLTTISFELFVRSSLDYFIGYSNYWRYKDIKLFTAPKRETKVYRKQLIKELRNARYFSDVQEIIFKEISTGQLELF